MAKRFIDTEIFNDDWFMELSKDAKLFYIYYITNCDHAGILKLNTKLAELQTGIKSIQTVIEQLSNCLLTIKPNVFLMPAFIKYQYPDFPKSKVKQQDSALKILASYGIDEEKIKSYLTVSKELNNSYDNVSVNEPVIDDLTNNKDSTVTQNLEPEKIHPLQTYVKEKFSRVTKLEKQLTYEECEKLLSKYPREKIASVLMSMENYKKITDKVSVYLTILKWIEKDNTKPTQETKEEVDMYGKPRPSNQHVLLNGKWFVH